MTLAMEMTPAMETPNAPIAAKSKTELAHQSINKLPDPLPDHLDDHLAENIDAQRWATVLARKTDSTFVYAVASTGIYCRTSCPSRRPSRQNVRFFRSAEEAAAHGFRACLRCTPSAAASPDRARIDRAKKYLDEQPDTRVTLTQLAGQIGLTPAHLLRSFRRVFGMTPRQYQASTRSQQFAKEVRREPRITDAIYAAGFGTASSAYSESQRSMGMTPAEFKRGGGGVAIVFTTVETSLGTMLAASTARGLCRVSFADGAGELSTDLKAAFPNANLLEMDNDDASSEHASPEHIEAATGLRAALQILEEKIDGVETSSPLPLDLIGTAFQHEVWRALQTIPPGTTWSYRQLATELGVPKATRAVGRACGQNPVSVVVPCHRVVASDGKLTGYRWGIERKRRLLEREAQSPGGGGGETNSTAR